MKTVNLHIVHAQIAGLQGQMRMDFEVLAVLTGLLSVLVMLVVGARR